MVEKKNNKLTITSVTISENTRVTLTNNNTLTVGTLKVIDEKIIDEVEYNLTIEKYGSDTGNVLLRGAKFTITANSNNKPSTFDGNLDISSTGKGTAKFTFKEEGTYIYTISETQEPEYYRKIEDITLTINVGKNNGKLYIISREISQVSGVTFENDVLNITEPRDKVEYTLDIKKYGSDTNGELLKGAKFTVTAEKDNKEKPSTFNPNIDISSTGQGTDTFTFYREGTYEYTISETTVPKDYEKVNDVTLTIVVARSQNRLYINSATINKVDGVKLTDSNKTIGYMEVTDEKIIEPTEYTIKIKKIDKDYREINIPGAQFRITGNGVDQTTAQTDENGETTVKIKVEDAGKTYKYILEETQVPEGYEKLDNIELTIQTGLNANENRYIAERITATGPEGINIETGNNETDISWTLTIPEAHKTIDISGTVWEDKYSGKVGDTDGKIGTGESGMPGISVKLVKVIESGKEVINKEYSTTTDNDGKYSFEGIRVSKDIFRTANYYVEFTYNGMTYTSTKYDSETLNGKNTSKAEETSRKEYNAKFQTYSEGKVNGSKGEIPLTYITKEGNNTEFATATLDTTSENEKAKFEINSETPKFEAENNITNLNLGLTVRNKADFSLQQGIKEAYARINNKTLATNEENFKDEDSKYMIEINGEKKELDGIKNYLVARNDTRNYYINKSDYTYRIGDYKDLMGNIKSVKEEDTLEIYITYKIFICNEGSVAGTVNELKNYYSDAYTIVKINDRDGKELKYNNEQTTNGYKVATIDASGINEIESGGTRKIEITYKVNKESNQYKNLESENITASVVTEINSYTTYSDNNDEKYSKGVVDKDSVPGNLNITTGIETHEDDTAQAPTIEIPELKTRTVKGQVWEDENVNGLKDDENLAIDGVTVQLVEQYNGGEFIWKEMQTGGKTETYIPFEELTEGSETKDIAGENQGKGKYFFEDFIPGDYIIRFIYGENEVQNIIYNGHDYESTISGENVDSKANDRQDSRKVVTELTKTVNNKMGRVLASAEKNEGIKDKIDKWKGVDWIKANNPSNDAQGRINNLKSKLTLFIEHLQTSPIVYIL